MTRQGYSNCTIKLIMSIWDSTSKSSPWQYRMSMAMLSRNINLFTLEQLSQNPQEAQVNRLLKRLRHHSSLFGQLLKTYILKLVRLTSVDMPRLLSLYSRPVADTRAAHLDRSRTKAALKQVSMRMYYQRLAALKSGYGIARNIKQYFIPKK